MGCMGCGGGNKKNAPRTTPKVAANPSRQTYTPKSKGAVVGYAGFGKPRIKMSRGR